MNDTNALPIKLLCLGPSQWPLLRSGNEILIDPNTKALLRPGDLVVYDTRGTRVCHRILARRGTGPMTEWLLKGDANFKVDGWIGHNEVLGRVVRVGNFSVDHPLFAIASRLLYWHSKLQYLAYRSIFDSPLGKRIGYWKYRFYRPPIFSTLFAKLTAPWLSINAAWELKSHSLKSWRDKIETRLSPPAREGFRLRPHRLDYGHALFYEELFCEGDGAIENLVPLCRGSRAVLDLAGGAGRLSLALANAGIPTVLVDNSNAMLEIARRRQQTLKPAARTRLQITCQDIRALALPHRFDKLISLNNGLEHVGGAESILETLALLRAHAPPSAEAFIDVHNLPFWERHRAHWKKGVWTQIQKFPLRRNRVRYLWERTAAGSDANEVVWEHAVSTFGWRYRLLKTAIHLFPRETWTGWFRQTGWAITETWGTWSGSASLPEHAKIIFRLRAE